MSNPTTKIPSRAERMRVAAYVRCEVGRMRRNAETGRANAAGMHGEAGAVTIMLAGKSATRAAMFERVADWMASDLAITPPNTPDPTAAHPYPGPVAQGE
jgi:hypothetical protein